MPLFLLLALAALQPEPATGSKPELAASSAGALRYSVALARAGDTTVAVSIELPDPLPGPVTLVIPRAVPMGYSQQPYDRFVSDVAAVSPDGASLAVEREEGPRFRIGTQGTSVKRLSWRVDLARMEREILGAADASRARPLYVGLLGYSVFGYLDGHGTRPVQLEIAAPADWPVFTTLAPAAPPRSERRLRLQRTSTRSPTRRC